MVIYGMIIFSYLAIIFLYFVFFIFFVFCIHLYTLISFNIIKTIFVYFIWHFHKCALNKCSEAFPHTLTHGALTAEGAPQTLHWSSSLEFGFLQRVCVGVRRLRAAGSSAGAWLSQTQHTEINTMANRKNQAVMNESKFYKCWLNDSNVLWFQDKWCLPSQASLLLLLILK